MVEMEIQLLPRNVLCSVFIKKKLLNPKNDNATATVVVKSFWTPDIGGFSGTSSLSVTVL